MIVSYIRSAHRNAIRNKVQSIIQVLSLSIGLAIFTLVVIYLYDEYTVERSNPVMKQVYRVEMPGLGVDAQDVIPFTIGPELEAEISEIKHMTRLNYNPEDPIAIVFSISLATVARQANRTSRANPLGSLKTE